MDNSHDVSVLNTLIATTLDSVNGYRDASHDSTTTNARFFAQMSEERQQVVSQLQGQVRSLGGDPEDDASTMGSIHRGFMKLKDAVMSRDEKAVVNEVERGEDYLKEKFQQALKDDRLSASSRTIVEQAYASVRSGHDRVSQMKHAMN